MSKQSKCSICELSVTKKQKGMICELCEEWKHAECDKVSAEVYKLVGDNAEETRLHWFCSECNVKAVKGIKLVLCVEKRTTEIENDMVRVRQEIEQKMGVLAELSQELEQLKTDVKDSKAEMQITVDDSMEKSLAESESVQKMIKDNVISAMGEIDDGGDNPHVLTTRIEQLKEELLQDLKQKTNDNPDAVTEVNAAAAVNAPEDWTVVMKRELAKVMNQKVETGKREKNVILYRAVEKKEEARKNDVELVKSLLLKCGVKEGMEAVQEFKRIGAKSEGRERPILLIFKELGQKITLFKNLRNLKTAEQSLKSISVSHDMSQEEREITKKLVIEAKKKEQADPEHRYRVRGPPGNQRIVQLDPLGESD